MRINEHMRTFKEGAEILQAALSGRRCGPWELMPFCDVEMYLFVWTATRWVASGYVSRGVTVRKEHYITCAYESGRISRVLYVEGTR